MELRNLEITKLTLLIKPIKQLSLLQLILVKNDFSR